VGIFGIGIVGGIVNPMDGIGIVGIDNAGIPKLRSTDGVGIAGIVGIFGTGIDGGTVSPMDGIGMDGRQGITQFWSTDLGSRQEQLQPHELPLPLPQYLEKQRQL
jgi:hypothetical protein